MDFGTAIRSGFNNYVAFSGRASRSEYWYWTLFTILAGIVAGIVDSMVFGSGLLQGIVNLALLLPSLGVAVRRLHDINRTGWWLLIAFTVIGIIFLIIWDCQKSDPGPNQYGPNPLEGGPV